MCNDTHTALVGWQRFWGQLKTLEALLVISERRARYVWTCLRGTPLECKASRVLPGMLLIIFSITIWSCVFLSTYMYIYVYLYLSRKGLVGGRGCITVPRIVGHTPLPPPWAFWGFFAFLRLLMPLRRGFLRSPDAGGELECQSRVATSSPPRPPCSCFVGGRRLPVRAATASW
jgi:hypothetical protein